MQQDKKTFHVANLVTLIRHLDPDYNIIDITPIDQTFHHRPSVHVHLLWDIAQPWDWNIDDHTDKPNRRYPYRAWVTINDVIFLTHLDEEEHQLAMHLTANHQRELEAAKDTLPE